jgi:LPS export ABC transporter permease LptG
LTALQSLGVSQITLAKPFLALGLVGTLITCYLSVQVAPAALRTLKSLRSQILLQEANTRIKPHTFITSFPNLLLYVQSIDPQSRDWLGVFLMQNDPATGSSRLLTAERGQFRIESGQSLTLESQLFNGVSLEYDGQYQRSLNLEQSPPSSQSTGVFTKLTVKLMDNRATLPTGKEAGSLAEMSLNDISKLAVEAKTDKEKRQARAEIHKRFAFPFACLTLTAMTFLLAIQGKRFSTRPRTVVVILFLAMGFYLFLVLGQNLALSGVAPVWLGVWFSNFIYGAFILKSFISSRPPLARVLALLSSPSPAGGAGFPGKSHALDTQRQPSVSQPSRGVRVISLNLINYLLVSEITKYFLLALLALALTSTIFTLFDLIPSMIKNATPLLYAASYLAYLAPQLAYYVAPFSLLVALLMSFSVLSRSNQLVVIAGAGQSRVRIVAAVLVTSLALSLILWAVSNYLLPHTNREQDARYNVIKGRQVEQTTIAFGRKWVFGRDNSIYSYQRIDPDNGLVNTSIYRLGNTNGLLQSVTHFSKAISMDSTTWKAQNGWMEIINPDSTVERRAIQQPELINISDGVGLFRRTTNESSKMSAWELREHISQLKSLGVSTLELQIDLKKRVAFPFSCLVLAILAIPFITVKQARRAGPLASISISVGIGLVFWLLATLFEAAGKQENLPVGIAVWGPHILFGAVGLYLNFVRHRLQ